MPIPELWATEAAQYIRSISAVEISVCTFAFFGHGSDRSLVQSHHEKSQTTYPRAFLRSRNCIRNICDATDEKNHQFSPFIFELSKIAVRMSFKNVSRCLSVRLLKCLLYSLARISCWSLAFAF